MSANELRERLAATVCAKCSHAAERHRTSDDAWRSEVCGVRYVDGAQCYCTGYRPRSPR